MRSDEMPLVLTDAGLETVLLFKNGIDLPSFAAFPLLDSDEGRAALRRYYEPFLRLARDRGTGFVLSSPTWRANPDWGEELDVLTPSERDGVVVEGCIGPRSDAYQPGLRMDALEAERYHGLQLRALAEADCDQAAALTLGYVEEAVGIVRAATAVGLPVVIGFTLETDGRLPSGDSIEEAIEVVDHATDGAARSFMINCAHPAHFADALPEGSARERIHVLRANASMKSHEELDAADELDEGDPVDLGKRYLELRDELPHLHVLGGCCGTDIGHVTAICDTWLASA